MTYSYIDDKTQEVVSVHTHGVPWLALADVKARALRKGHTFTELRYVPVEWHEDNGVPFAVAVGER